MRNKHLLKYDNYSTFCKLKFCLILIVVLSLCTLLFSTCKKYPDDHKISLQTAKKRLRAHPWYFSKLTINGADSTMAHLRNIIPSAKKPSELYFKIIEGMNYNTDGGEVAYPFVAKPNSAYPDYSSPISIDKKKKVLKIGGGFVDNYNQGAITPSTMNSILYVYSITRGGENWEITKLTKKDFHIHTIYDNYDVKFEFVATP